MSNEDKELMALIGVLAGDTPDDELVDLDFTEDGVTHEGAITVEMQVDARAAIQDSEIWAARLPRRSKVREDMVPE